MGGIARLGRSKSYFAVFCFICAVFLASLLHGMIAGAEVSPFFKSILRWSGLAFFVGMMPVLAAVLGAARKDNLLKYDPKSSKIRNSAILDGLVGLVLASIPFAALFIGLTNLPPAIVFMAAVFSIFVGVHLVVRAALSPFGAYPWRWLPEKRLSKNDT